MPSSPWAITQRKRFTSSARTSITITLIWSTTACRICTWATTLRFPAAKCSKTTPSSCWAGGTRRPQDVAIMEEEYGWPRHHRADYPDLVGPEIAFNDMVEHFNAGHKHVQAVLVNQFGWSRELIGTRVPADMTFADLRRATDVEFGMAGYEPFGISPLEA